MTNNKIIALVTSLILCGSAMYSVQTNAESTDTLEYSSDVSTSEDISIDDTSSDVTTSMEVPTLKSYEEYDANFLKQLVIVGDSIASGFNTYDRLPSEQVLAVGSLGARNIHTFEFTIDGQELDILDALSVKQPKYIFMSMGMNDINLSTSEEFVNNYTQNINDIFEICPNATIIVMGITPVISYSDFSDNDKIDTYNDSLKQMAISMQGDGSRVYYINVSKYLKDEQNGLKSEFSSGDGIHLSGSAYDYIFTSMMLSLEWIV